MSSKKAGIITSGFGNGCLLVTQGYGTSFLALTAALFETLILSTDFLSKWDALKLYVEEVHTSETFGTQLDARRIVFETISILTSLSLESVIIRNFEEYLLLLSFTNLWGWKLFLTESLRLGSVTKSFFKGIEEIVSRLIPRERFPLKISISVFGDLFSKISEKAEIEGFPFKKISLPIYLIGNPVSKISKTLLVLGSSSVPSNLHIIMLGTVIHKLELLMECRGIKDFKRIIWEILEEE